MSGGKESMEEVNNNDDFYLAVNGAWIRDHPVPQDRDSYGAFTELQDAAELNLQLIIESAAGGTGAQDPEIRKIGDFYRAGMDLAAIEHQGITPLKGEFDRIAALTDTSGLRQLIAYLATWGINPLFGLFAETDPRDSTMMIAGLSQGGLGLPNKE